MAGETRESSALAGFAETEEVGIVDAVQHYFFDDEELALFLREWCLARASAVDVRPGQDAGACSLELSSLHRDFLRELEDKLTEFVDRNGSSIEAFTALLAKAPLDSDHDVFAKVLQASVSFELFVAAMRSVADHAAQKGCEASSP